MKRKEYEKNIFLNEIYPLNTATGNLMIEIHLEQYIYLFNEWDNASFKRRDLDPDLIYFLEECSQEIPLKYDIELNISITEEERDLQKEKNIIKGFRTQYIHYLRVERRNLKELSMRAVLYVVTAFALIFTASMLESTLSAHPISTTLLEGFYVGGWVFAWEAISSFSFHRGGITRKIKEYQRFLRAPIQFIYSSKDQ
ncbi:hypothetical protein [Clostridium formicaceticum]|uniref:Uncharacterized protein n=1 Tax=Clostridium formicaceticum TaxID=1497 RepID=A0AAC9RIC6_9CLOT|nr:hypothetical protein [Clostridium formicaceticum]AOY75994.1 hypothetical protein BJL90_08840 [Clostridium formicaceticum]ARE86347.1 hypothetical protein CLFO_06690 [Clostridium formicaceticum]